MKNLFPTVGSWFLRWPGIALKTVGQWLVVGFLVGVGLPTRAEPTADGLYAGFITSRGNFWCRLEYRLTPRTVANFVSLAEGTRPWIDFANSKIVQRPFYTGITFHRVITNFMIQGGSPNGNGTDGPGYQFADEFAASLRHTQPGTLSMANSGPNSNGSQFFVTVEPTPWLDNKHTIFGQVVEGLDVVYDINKVPTSPANDRPLTPVVIQEVRILRVGTEAQAFDPAALVKPLPTVSVIPTALTLTNDSRVTFLRTDLADWKPFATRLKTSTDPVSVHLLTRLSSTSQTGLSSWNPTAALPTTLRDTLVADLNNVVTGAPLWDAARFAGVTLRAQTVQLRQRNPTGTALAELNRLLLEDAYPDSLPRIELLLLDLQSGTNRIQYVFFGFDLFTWRYQAIEGTVDRIDASGLLGYPNAFFRVLDGGFEP